MSLPFAAALRQLGNGLATALTPATIRAACRAAGHTWRERRLDPVATAHLFVLQILHGNTACAHLPRLTGRTFSASAYCQARARLPVAVLRALLQGVTAAAQPLDTVGRWRGHRTWFVDGTGVSMPDAPDLTRAFGYAVNQRRGCGFPVAKVVALFHAGTGRLQSLLPGPLRSMAMFARVYNLVRVVMTEAGRRQGVPVERISFVDALRWLASSPPGTPLPRLVANPDRPDRVEPRCQKRRGKNDPYRIHPRGVLRHRRLAQVPPP